MKILCAPKDFEFSSVPADLGIVLYDQSDIATQGSVGAAVKYEIAQRRLNPAPRAWDLLSIALAAVAADLAGHRDKSPDGWTREFGLTVAVIDPAFWNGQADVIVRLLSYLTTDRWMIRFVALGHMPKPPRVPVRPSEECVALLSGGLDSLIGVIDLAAAGKKVFVVSELVRGDAEKQRDFATAIGGGLTHLQLHHNSTVPNPETPPSQRARSIVFLAYGVLAATALGRYHAAHRVDLNICENGFIAVNPPLTGSRVGSLSTRTTHPIVLALFQQLLTSADLRVDVTNPYRFKTKGEMLAECRDQTLLQHQAHTSTSCGRFLRFGYIHCGRCVPCLVRRAAFRRWGRSDPTLYKYADLSKLDSDHAEFDDVRAAAMAILEREEIGISRWLGASLSSALVTGHDDLSAVVGRGLDELKVLLTDFEIL
jgi:7-cyano-7-deazaguanine synthase in queuosine biosynthesis